MLLYAGFLVYQSLAAGGPWQCGGAVLSMDARLSRSDLLANAVAYVPLGLLWVFATTRSSVAGWRRVPLLPALGVLLVAALSASMELLQSCLAARVSSAYDCGANVLGGAVGVSAALLLRASAGGIRSRAAHHWHDAPDGWLRALAAMVAGAWVVSQTMPWVFAADVGTIRSNLSFLRHWSDGPPLDAWHALRHAGAWVAVACACRLAARSARLAAAGVVCTGGVSLLLQVLMDARTPLSFEELIGMGASAAVVLPLMLHAGPNPQPGRWAIALFSGALSSVAAYELRPGPSAVVTERAFNWWPQVGLGGPLGALDYALLFGWFGLASVVAARWADVAGYKGARRWWPGLAVVAMLVLEIVQTRIPGRGPDVSAPLFTLLAVLGANACVEHGNHAASSREAPS